MKYILVYLVSMFLSPVVFAQEMDCDVNNPEFVKDFFNHKSQWKGSASAGVIFAKINFHQPVRSQFDVSGETAPISNIKATSCERIKFKLKYDGEVFNASLIKKGPKKVVVNILYYVVTIPFELTSI